MKLKGKFEIFGCAVPQKSKKHNLSLTAGFSEEVNKIFKKLSATRKI